MRKCTKLFAVITASLMVLGASATAFAAPSADEKAANGDTTIGVMETSKDPSSVSFEVPLYVTLAAVNNKADVVAPGANVYMIKNTSGAVGSDAYSIGVVGMSFETLNGGTWATTLTAAPTGNVKEMNLKIGGLQMPALAAGGVAGPTAVQINADTPGVFYDAPNTKPVSIAPGTTLDIPIAGKISTTAVTADAPAAPQFKVKYTISAIGVTGGDAIGKTYVGDDSKEAGFGTWNDTTHQFDPADTTP